MVDVQLRERERDNYLLALYELADGRTANWSTHRGIAGAAGIADDEVFLAGRDLVDQGLCKFETSAGLDGHVSITQAGIAKAELLLTGRSTRISDEELRRNVETILYVLLVEVEKEDVPLSADDLCNVKADLQSVEDQLKASVPNRGIIKSGLERVRALWPTIVDISAVAANLTTVLRGW